MTTLTSEFQSSVENMQRRGYTCVYVSLNETLAGVICLSDVIRPEAKMVVDHLRTRRHGAQVWMITGDSDLTAATVAAQVGIPAFCVLSRATPGVKVEKLSILQNLGRTVAFIGQDAPAWAAADVSMALGGGAIFDSKADILLTKCYLGDVLNVLALAQATQSRVWWNFVWALVYHLVAIPLASGGMYFALRCWTRSTTQGHDVRGFIPLQVVGLSELLSSVPVFFMSLALEYRFCFPYSTTSTQQPTTIIATSSSSSQVMKHNNNRSSTFGPTKIPNWSSSCSSKSEKSPLLMRSKIIDLVPLSS